LLFIYPGEKNPVGGIYNGLEIRKFSEKTLFTDFVRVVRFPYSKAVSPPKIYTRPLVVSTKE
jgi:hypothetical protein